MRKVIPANDQYIDNFLQAAKEKNGAEIDELLKVMTHEDVNEACKRVMFMGSVMSEQQKSDAGFLLPLVLENDNIDGAEKLFKIEEFNLNEMGSGGLRPLSIIACSITKEWKNSKAEMIKAWAEKTIDNLLEKLTPSEIQQNFDLILERNLRQAGEFLLPKVAEIISEKKLEFRNMNQVEKLEFRKWKNDFSKTVLDFSNKGWSVEDNIDRSYECGCVIT